MEMKEPNSGIISKGKWADNYRISFCIARDPSANSLYGLPEDLEFRSNFPPGHKILDTN